MSTTQFSVDQVVELLERVPLFQGLPRADLERIAGLVGPRAAKPGELLFRENDPGDRFYIVYSGAVEILKEKPRGEHERLAVRRAGEAFGEMALLTDAPRSASARVAEPSQLLAVSREQFETLLGGETLAVRMMRGLARALRAMDVRFAAQASLGGEVDALGEFSRVVQKALLPRHIPDIPDYDVAGALIQRAGGAGNALWDVAQRKNGTPLLGLFDVKGAGLPPAYLLGVVRGLMRSDTQRGTPIDRFLPNLTEAVTAALFEGLDECVVGAVLELRAGDVAWSAAGEPSGLVVRSGGTVEELPSHGPPLGILPGFEYGVQTVALRSGDVLVAFSEAERGIRLGAGELVRTHRQKPAAQLAALLQVALGKAAGTERAGQDGVLLVVKRD